MRNAEMSVTTLQESPLSRWLFRECVGRYALWSGLELSASTIPFFEVGEPLIEPSRKPGDVDVLLCDPEYPEEAVVVECKTVKVPSVAFHTLLPGKLRGLTRGVSQANALFRYGFSRTYLLILVLVDGREQGDISFPFRGLTTELVRIIDAFPNRKALGQEVGLGFIEVTQPVDKPIESAGGIGVRVVRRAKQCVQDPLLTAKIADLLTTQRRA